VLAAAASGPLVDEYLAAALADRARPLWRVPAAANAALRAEETFAGAMGDLLTS
jgi:hypothetical protein